MGNNVCHPLVGILVSTPETASHTRRSDTPTRAGKREAAEQELTVLCHVWGHPSSEPLTAIRGLAKLMALDRYIWFVTDAVKPHPVELGIGGKR